MGNGNSVRGVQSGRRIREGDVEHIKAVVSGCKGLSRKEIAETICEHWGWVTASGANKTQACMKLLEKLERQNCPPRSLLSGNCQAEARTRVRERGSRPAPTKAIGVAGGRA